MKIVKLNWLIVILICISITNTFAQQNGSVLTVTQTSTNVTLQSLIESSMTQSQKIRINKATVQRSRYDKQKAYEAYLPKITAEVSYTHLNDDIRLPSAMEDLLTATQKILIKEQAAMKMTPLTTIPDAYKVNFGTSYTGTSVPSQQLSKAVSENLKEISPLQKQDILKANISAQMVLFSGMKVPYTIEAVNHQIKATELLNEKEVSTIISEVVTTYDKLAVIAKSEEVLNNSEKLLNEQSRFVEGAVKNGLAIRLDQQKIELARQQLAMKRVELNSNKKLILAKLEQLSGVPAEKMGNIQPKLSTWNTQSNNDVTNRSEVRALNEYMQATDYKRKIEYSEYIPKVVAFGKKELITKYLSTFDPEWYVGVAVRWTLFDGLNSHTSAQQAKLDRVILEERKEEAIEMLNLNLKRVQFDVEKNNQLAILADQQVKTAQENFNLTKKQYEAGLVTMTDYLNSLSALEAAQLDAIKAKYQQRVSTVELLDATGNLTIDSIKE